MYSIIIKKLRQWPVKDKGTYCDKCGLKGTYGDGKTWNRCFYDLNREPKPRIILEVVK